MSKKINKIAGYRVMIGFNQTQMGKVLGISKQAYSCKERGKNQFTDSEKVKLRNFLKDYFPNISVEELFFY